MELRFHLQTHESFTTALHQGVSGVSIPIPSHPDSPHWSELANWRAAARQAGLKFYLVWDALLTEKELPRAAAILSAIDLLDPNGLQLRDLGLVAETRRLYPHLPLIAAPNWGAHNSPAVRLAESLGFSQVALEGPVSLKDLALIGRQTTLPLSVTLPSDCQGYVSLCLLDGYTGGKCDTCCLSRSQNFTPQVLMGALETFSGLCQLGLAAVNFNAGLFAPDSLAQVIELFQSVSQAPAMERPQVLAAIRQIVATFGERLLSSEKPAAAFPDLPSTLPPRRSASGSTFPGRRIWLEARDYPEALALSRQWREPLIIALTPDNYTPFLKDHRRWGPRRLIWRLPSILRESSLPFYQKALDTLGQGGYNRFIAGDWGAVALIRTIGGQIYGDQTLGVRNSRAFQIARTLKVTRICLPPSPYPERHPDFLKAAPGASFWGYLYQAPPLAFCSDKALDLPPQSNLLWVPDAGSGRFVLTLKTPLDLNNRGAWLKQQGIFPLVIALPRSPLPQGQLPAWLVLPPRKALGK